MTTSIPTLQRIGVLAHPNRPNTAPVAQHISETLKARGLFGWQFAQWSEADITENVRDTDLVIAIGGDGAMLRAARACARFDVPVLGVNMGFLGFLTEIDRPEEWDRSLETLLSGAYWVERRMMINVTAMRGTSITAESDALNDAVVSRGNVTRMIRLPTYIDNHWTTTYHADALILSTATGSTAYALACGGPILPPELRNILVVPVAPHLSLDRPIVLPEGATIEVIVSSDMETDPVLAVDGARLCELHPGDKIIVQASERGAQFIRLRDRNYFYRSLLDRLEPRVQEPTR
jgi:NAD+ kinase